jgi:uncharacterized protein (TIGR03083 family)
MNKMKPLEPIYTTELFPKIESELIVLLKSLSDDDWQKPTVCAEWSVKDIAAHLLDTSLRKLSMQRDGYFGEKGENINSYQDLVAFLNRLNADWVRAARRLSPQVLISLLEQTGREVYELLKTLDPHDKAMFSVAWAGEEVSENWFDIAREYTERWHHQQQIRLAVNKPGAMTRELYFPVLDAFMRALPHTYKDVEAEEKTLLKFHITGDAGGVWFLLRENNRWNLGTDAEGEILSYVVIPQEIAWRIFTKGIDKEEARKQITITGNEKLGEVILNTLAVMA